MNIFKILDTIEKAIHNSQPVPLSRLCLIDREKFLNLIEKTRAALPEEMKQAQWITQENQRILQEASDKAEKQVREAQEQARSIIREAQAERERLINQDDVVVEARKTADQVMRTAEGEAQELKARTDAQTTEQLRQAEAQARRVRDEADEAARTSRREAETYAFKVLSGMERELGKVLGIIRKNCDEFRGPDGQFREDAGPPTANSFREGSPSTPLQPAVRT